MTKIIFGINVPYQSSDIDWDATEAKRKEMQARGEEVHFWKTMVRVPCIRTKKELSFELCDICGTQIVGGRRKRRLTTCCPDHNQKKWDAKNGLIIQRERKLVGERPTHFWLTISWECFERDAFTCQMCGKKKEELEKDRETERNRNGYSYLDYSLNCHHIVPISEGGTNELENLITYCGRCHKKKHSHYENVARRSYRLEGW